MSRFTSVLTVLMFLASATAMSVEAAATGEDKAASGRSGAEDLPKEDSPKNDSAQVRALVNRQVQAWEKRDFAIAADDWLPSGELFSPGGHVVKTEMQSAITDYFKNFTDLKVMVNDVFVSEDGTKLAIQWDWTVTRKRDGKRAMTHDAILVHLVGGKIATWSEYFDFGNSVDAKP